MDPSQLLAMIQRILPTMAGNGQVGNRMTPGMQQAATQGGAMTPQDASTATVANAAPNAPAPSSFGSTNPLGGLSGGTLAQLAKSLSGGGNQREPRQRIPHPFRAGQGAPPMPISQPPFGKPPMPQQAAGAPPMAVGGLNASPAGQQIIKALLAQMGRGVSASG